MNSFNPFLGIYAVGFFARLSYALARSPVLPLFALYFGAGPEAIGWVVGVSTVTGIFFKLPAGALSDIIGRKRTMLVGLIVFAVMPFTYLLVTDVLLLTIIRFLHGFATAIYGPVSMAVIADLAGSKKGEMLSWFSSVTIIGNLLGAPIGGYVLYSMSKNAGLSLHDFQIVYLLSGCAGLISLFCAWRYLRGQESIQRRNGLKGSLNKFASGIREVVSDRRVVVTSSMEGLQNMTMGALEAFLPVYAVKTVGLNELQAGLLWGIQVLVTILSKPIMGRMSDGYGRKPVIVAGMVLCAVSFACIPMLRTFHLLMITAAFFGLGEAFVTSSSAALVADICKERHFGTAMGTFGTIFDIGHASGPIVAGILIARWGYLHAFWSMGALLLLAAPVFILSVDVGKPQKIAHETIA
jgi:DHA1 family multidrug resistance protein-like MFS transporter